MSSETTAAPTVLAVENIHKRFGEIEVLRGISLEARNGDVVSILGSSGSGKSTFLRCLNFLETPSAGRIHLHGEEIRTRRDRAGMLRPADHGQLTRLRARVGMVFQQFNLWPHMTVLSNLVEAPRRVRGLGKAEAIEKAEALLEKVGLAERRDYYPAHLSGGQQQRVAIARALAMDPEVILFDEPTSALDPELVGEVLAVIEALANEGRTMLIVTHEIGFARDVSTRTLFLHEGRVEEDGAPAALFTAPESERLRKFLSRHLH
ncbi:ABC transporter ATP-binding protein [Rhodospira trueperi]|uniref:Polar amino acid transport system ATP-binding protein/octopine/nopaline transport system ATP-binding protein/arginine/ornithine transport system ATP-binding protein n=1 Tax=Rhodospira trueperi TaxID=69960 RepID=A0A1G7GBW3_9PROT|nr:ATP-binding cassette domain-containing protein [Rhodospira trueperi]SDE85583.1 polar amino acid transport system ATP-binding protein/octopine/nopaline transport system ATP-binding protein/arginine/ornithine transport system ATP-binding protein [Rhodospira trueperi]